MQNVLQRYRIGRSSVPPSLCGAGSIHALFGDAKINTLQQARTSEVVIILLRIYKSIILWLSIMILYKHNPVQSHSSIHHDIHSTRHCACHCSTLHIVVQTVPHTCIGMNYDPFYAQMDPRASTWS